MTLLARHLLHQGPAFGAFGKLLLQAALQSLDRGAPRDFSAPGPLFRAEVACRPEALVRDYVHHVGGTPGYYAGRLPAHLFPQWCLPLGVRLLEGLSGRLLKVVNGGCRLQVNGPLYLGRPLHVTAQLLALEHKANRLVLHQRFVTEQPGSPLAVLADVYAVMPPRRIVRTDANGNAADDAGRAAARPAPVVPDGASELCRLDLDRGAGTRFAWLTGDFNPIHTSHTYARSLGFQGVILHGFAALARVMESFARAKLDGDVDRIRVLDVRFRRPITLPAQLGLFCDQAELFVGERQQSAYLTGSLVLRDTPVSWNQQLSSYRNFST